MTDRQPRVLVVDDELDFLELFTKRFQRRGLDVASCSNGPDALRYLDEHEMDVVVLDVRMPKMDGIEVLKEIKKRHPAVQVIMLTGHGSVNSGIQGMSHGAYDYVMKPFNLDDLMGRITQAVERKRLQEGH
ncbi:MAG: sigma-54-dependent transcriptional regulator [Desulfovibrionaceae bacterium]